MSVCHLPFADEIFIIATTLLLSTQKSAIAHLLHARHSAVIDTAIIFILLFLSYFLIYIDTAIIFLISFLIYNTTAIYYNHCYYCYFLIYIDTAIFLIYIPL